MNVEQGDVDPASSGSPSASETESSVNPSAIDTDRWQWMKHYRVWEANRKVFLYPENWIEPELRDDKTPFFKELESELLQNELTVNTIETAFGHYLQKLDEVARLDLCGMYWQQEEESHPGKGDNIDVLPVFGRTFSQPRIYYYRRLVNRNTWSPWEKVDVDIEGDHLVPVIYNRRLYLFWPIFATKTDEREGTYLQINLAWSEYKQSKWSPKHVSSDKAALVNKRPGFSASDNESLPLQRSHILKAQLENDQMVIRVLEDWKGFIKVKIGATTSSFGLSSPSIELKSFMSAKGTYLYHGDFSLTSCRRELTVKSTADANAAYWGLEENWWRLATPDNSTLSGMLIEQDPPKTKSLEALLTFVTGDFGDRLNLDYKTKTKGAPDPSLGNDEMH